MRAMTVLMLGTSLVLLNACASIVQGSSQRFTVLDPQKQATNCTISNGRGTQQAVTPNTVFVKKSKTDIKVNCADPARGVQGEKTVKSHVENWFWGNILIGGLIGVGVDAGTGAMWEYPKEVTVDMNQPYGYVPTAQAPTTAPVAPMATTAPAAPAPAASTAPMAMPAPANAAMAAPLMPTPAYRFIPVQPAAPAPAYAPAPANAAAPAPAAAPFGQSTPAPAVQYYAPARTGSY